MWRETLGELELRKALKGKVGAVAGVPWCPGYHPAIACVPRLAHCHGVLGLALRWPFVVPVPDFFKQFIAYKNCIV